MKSRACEGTWDGLSTPAARARAGLPCAWRAAFGRMAAGKRPGRLAYRGYGGPV
jgi:hypothetical protein